MRIEGSSGKNVDSVFLFLTESEARELRDSLEQMLTDRAEGGSTARHEHISSGDYKTEITIAWESA